MLVVQVLYYFTFVLFGIYALGTMPNQDEGSLLTSGASQDSVSSVTAGVAVKPPPFDETSVTRWFTIIESQFVLAKITVSSTKFHHILSNLPLRVINQLSDEVINSSDYGELKQSLISLFTRSKPELFDSLVNQNNIMCDRPSTYLRELRKIAAQLGVDDSFIKLKFLKALPSSIRPLLVTYEESSTLEELARVAETLLAYGSSNASVNNSANVSMVEGRQGSRPASQNRDNGNRGPNFTSACQDNVFSRTFVSIGVRAFHEGQRPQVCRYHLYYGNRAKSCKRWCILSSTASNILPDSRPNSRSSSPARVFHQAGN